MVFSGTAVTDGRGNAVVTATGTETEMGMIAGRLKETEDDRPRSRRSWTAPGSCSGLIVIGIAVVMVCATILLTSGVENDLGLPALLDVLVLAVSLAVAAVPGGAGRRDDDRACRWGCSGWPRGT